MKSRLYAIIINFPDVVVHKILPEDIKFVWGEEDALRAFYLFMMASAILTMASHGAAVGGHHSQHLQNHLPTTNLDTEILPSRLGPTMVKTQI